MFHVYHRESVNVAWFCHKFVCYEQDKLSLLNWVFAILIKKTIKYLGIFLNVYNIIILKNIECIYYSILDKHCGAVVSVLLIARIPGSIPAKISISKITAKLPIHLSTLKPVVNSNI